jgi:hypothetical protein
VQANFASLQEIFTTIQANFAQLLAKYAEAVIVTHALTKPRFMDTHMVKEAQRTIKLTVHITHWMLEYSMICRLEKSI